jgi:hypothetical protein
MERDDELSSHDHSDRVVQLKGEGDATIVVVPN